MEKQMNFRKKIEMRMKETIQDYQDPYRLGYHLTPLFGLMNDPNGLVYFNNKYHVFFQWNPFSTDHTIKCWGHASTRNFIDWELHTPALMPDEWYDKDGCYSGSAIVHNDQLYLFYTGNVRREDGKRETYQCLAVSNDGIHFEKKGPVIYLSDCYTSHFRDPKIWKGTDRWYVVIGAQNKELQGLAVLFSSNDLFHWKEERVLAGNGINGLKNFGYMWECPDFFELNDRHVLLVSPQGLKAKGDLYRNLHNSGYFVGDWDEKEKRFIHGSFEEIDHGFDFYAPQTFLDGKGRRILMAWMGMGDESELEQPTVQLGWVHGLTLPRQLVLNDGHIQQKPIEELQSLRNGPVTNDSLIVDKEKTIIPLASNLQEIQLEIEKMEGDWFVISFGTYCKLIYKKNGTFTVERKNWKTREFEQRACVIEKLTKIQIFLDRSSLEIFANDGEKVFTLRIFPEKKEESFLALESNQKLNIQVKGWSLREWDYKFLV